MRFVWFWTFWHWCKEAYREGSLLYGPLRGIAGNWDEWYRHEASPEDCRAIHEAGRTVQGQRRFVAWLHAQWAREAGWEGNRGVPRFVLRQLSSLPPFDAWPTLAKYRSGYGLAGPAAIVLAEQSAGEAADIREVEAIVLPADSRAELGSVVAEGFHVEESELQAARSAALSLLRGKGLVVLLARWAISGRRPYPRPVGALLGTGWMLLAALLAYLLAAPDPGALLRPLAAALVAVWAGLLLIAAAGAARQGLATWRQGAIWGDELAKSHVRLHMKGGMTLKGASAGFAFSLNLLVALRGLRTLPRLRAGLWPRFLEQGRIRGKHWAATGVITAEARVRPVVLEPKIRASLLHPGVEHVLTPRQRGGGRSAIRRLRASIAAAQCAPKSAFSLTAGQCLGFAAEAPRVACHPCSHLAQAVLLLGRLTCPRQLFVNAVAISVSLVLLAAAPDLKRILLPPPPPSVVGPSSPSSYFLWATLETDVPDSFFVVLESQFWSNRRVRVSFQDGARAPARAEIRLHRLARPATSDGENGTVWIERRHSLLGREMAPGERVGRYSLSYLTHLGHE